MQASNAVGWAIGVGVLLSAFFLPFWNLTSGGSSPFDTLYGAGRFVIYDLGDILQGGQGAASTLAFLFLAAMAIVGVSGLFGIFPRASGVLGVLGMLLLTVGPIMLDANFAFVPANYGSGYWAIWFLSLANIFVGVTMRRKGQSTPPATQATAPPSVPAPAPAPV